MRALATGAICILGLLVAAPRTSEAQVSHYTWHAYTGLSPTPTDWFHFLAYDTVRHQAICVNQWGGENVWLWNGAAWSDSGTADPGDYANVVFDTTRGVAITMTASGSLIPGRTWKWNGVGAWLQVNTNGPTSRTRCAMAYDSDRDRVVVFGGSYELDGPLPAYTWEWDGVNWHVFDTTTNGPSRRLSATMVYDPARRVTVLFGGTEDLVADSEDYGDTWTWDGSAWTRVATNGPSPRTLHSMAYDGHRERIILYGGSGDAAPPDTLALNDIWEWDGSTWTETVVAPGPPARYGHGMTYDSDRGEILVFGGVNRFGGTPVEYRDTWALRISEVWVDYAYSGPETGDFDTPFDTLAEAAALAAPESHIHFKPGTGTEGVTVTKRLELVAPLGPVTISGP